MPGCSEPRRFSRDRVPMSGSPFATRFCSCRGTALLFGCFRRSRPSAGVASDVAPPQRLRRSASADRCRVLASGSAGERLALLLGEREAGSRSFRSSRERVGPSRRSRRRPGSPARW